MCVYVRVYSVFSTIFSEYFSVSYTSLRFVSSSYNRDDDAAITHNTVVSCSSCIRTNGHGHYHSNVSYAYGKINVIMHLLFCFYKKKLILEHILCVYKQIINLEW